MQRHFWSSVAIALLVTLAPVNLVFASLVTELSLDDCVQLALKNNPKIKIAQDNREKSREVIQQAESAKGIQLRYIFDMARSNIDPNYPGPDSGIQMINTLHSAGDSLNSMNSLAATYAQIYQFNGSQSAAFSAVSSLLTPAQQQQFAYIDNMRAALGLNPTQFSQLMTNTNNLLKSTSAGSVMLNPLPANFPSGDALAPLPFAYNYYSNALILSYPISTGGKVEAAIEKAKLGSQISDNEVTAIKNQVKLDATIGYCNVLQASNMRDVACQTVADFQEHLHNVEQKYDAGVANLPDLLQTKVRLADAENNLIKAENAYTLAVYNLNNTMGLPLKGEIKLMDEFSFASFTLDMDKCIGKALAERPEIAQVKLNVAVNKAQVKIAKGDGRPTIAFRAMNLWSGQDSPGFGNGLIPSQHDDFPGWKNSSWMLSLMLSMNVFDSGHTSSLVKQAKAGEMAAQDQATKVLSDVSLDVSAAYLNVKEAEKRISTNQVALEQAEVGLKLTKQRYDAGVGTNLDVMDAELYFHIARTNYIQALYDFNISKAKLDRAMGG
jgi:outer membrane protein